MSTTSPYPTNEPYNSKIKQYYASKSSKMRISISRLILLELGECLNFILDDTVSNSLSNLSPEDRKGRIILGSTLLTPEILQVIGTICTDLVELTKIQPQIVIYAKRQLLLEILDLIDFVTKMVVLQPNVPLVQYTIEAILQPIHFVFSTTPSLYILFSRAFTPLVCQLIPIGHLPTDSRIICITMLNEMTTFDGLFHNIYLLISANPSTSAQPQPILHHQVSRSSPAAQQSRINCPQSQTNEAITKTLSQSRELLLPLYTQLIEPYIQPIAFTMTLTFDLRLLIPLTNVVLKLISLFYLFESLSTSQSSQHFSLLPTSFNPSTTATSFQSTAPNPLFNPNYSLESQTPAQSFKLPTLPSTHLQTLPQFQKIFLSVLHALQLGLFRVNQRIYHRSMAQLQIERNYIQFPSTIIDTNYINDYLEECMYLNCTDPVYMNPSKNPTSFINSQLSIDLLPLIIQRACRLRMELADFLAIPHQNGVICEINMKKSTDGKKQTPAVTITSNQHVSPTRPHFSSPFAYVQQNGIRNSGSKQQQLEQLEQQLQQSDRLHSAQYYRDYMEKQMKQTDEVSTNLSNLVTPITFEQLVIKDYYQTTQAMELLFILLEHTQNNAFQVYPFSSIADLSTNYINTNTSVNNPNTRNNINTSTNNNNTNNKGFHDVLISQNQNHQNHQNLNNSSKSSIPPLSNPLLKHLSIFQAPQLHDRPGVLLISLPTNQMLIYQPSINVSSSIAPRHTLPNGSNSTKETVKRIPPSVYVNCIKLFDFVNPQLINNANSPSSRQRSQQQVQSNSVQQHSSKHNQDQQTRANRHQTLPPSAPSSSTPPTHSTIALKYKHYADIHRYIARALSLASSSFPQQNLLPHHSDFKKHIYRGGYPFISTRFAPPDATFWTDVAIEHSYLPHIHLNPSYQLHSTIQTLSRQFHAQQQQQQQQNPPTMQPLGQIYVPHAQIPTFQLFSLITSQSNYIFDTIPKIAPHAELTITLPRWNIDCRRVSSRAEDQTMYPNCDNHNAQGQHRQSIFQCQNNATNSRFLQSQLHLSTTPYYHYLNRYILPTLTHPHPHTAYLASLTSTLQSSQPVVLVADFRYFPSNQMDGECLNKILFDPSSALSLEQVYLYNWFVIGLGAVPNSYLLRYLNSLSLLTIGMAGYDENGIGPSLDFYTQSLEQSGEQSPRSQRLKNLHTQVLSGAFDHIDGKTLSQMSIHDICEHIASKNVQSSTSSAVANNNINNTSSLNNLSKNNNLSTNPPINNNSLDLPSIAGHGFGTNAGSKSTFRDTNDANHRMTELVLRSYMIQHQLSNQLATMQTESQSQSQPSQSTDGQSPQQPTSLDNDNDDVFEANTRGNNQNRRIHQRDPSDDNTDTSDEGITHASSLTAAKSVSVQSPQFHSPSVTPKSHRHTSRRSLPAPKQTTASADQTETSPIADEIIARALKSPLALLSPQQLIKILSPPAHLVNPSLVSTGQHHSLNHKSTAASVQHENNPADQLHSSAIYDPTNRTRSAILAFLLQSSKELNLLKNSFGSMTYEQLFASMSSVIDQLNTKQLQLIHLVEGLPTSTPSTREVNEELTISLTKTDPTSQPQFNKVPAVALQNYPNNTAKPQTSGAHRDLTLKPSKHSNHNHSDSSDDVENNSYTNLPSQRQGNKKQAPAQRFPQQLNTALVEVSKLNPAKLAGYNTLLDRLSYQILPTAPPAIGNNKPNTSKHNSQTPSNPPPLRLGALENSINHLMRVEESTHEVLRATILHLLENQDRNR